MWALLPPGFVLRLSVLPCRYAPRLVYKEAQVYPSFMAGFISLFEMLALGTALFCPPLRSMLKRWALPKPGEVPSASTLEQALRTHAHCFRTIIVARGTDELNGTTLTHARAISHTAA